MIDLVLESRPNTDDTAWVIPEIIHDDMYNVAALVRSLRRLDGEIFDCGAHIGVFSCMLAAHGVRQPIRAFEPAPDNYRLLALNSARFPTVTPIPKAVGVAAGVRCLFDQGDTGRWTFTPVRPGPTVNVDVVCLADEIRRAGQVALLKLDLEGYEAELLAQLPADVLQRVRILIIEEHHRSIDLGRLRRIGFARWFNPGQSGRHHVLRRDPPWGEGTVLPRAAPSRGMRLLVIAHLDKLSRRMDKALFHRYQALGNLPGVTVTGPGSEGFHAGMSITELLDLHGHCDFILHGVDIGITCKPLVDGLADVSIPKALELVDTWWDWLPQQQFIRSQRFQYAFHTPRPWEGGYEENCPETRFIWTPNAIDTKVFRDYELPKDTDILYYGCVHSMYPLRQRLVPLLERMRDAGDCHVEILTHPGYHDVGYVPVPGDFVGETLARKINGAKIAIATQSEYGSLFSKHLEIAACNTALAGSAPDQARPWLGDALIELADLSDEAIRNTLLDALKQPLALRDRARITGKTVRDEFALPTYASRMMTLIGRLVAPQ